MSGWWITTDIPPSRRQEGTRAIRDPGTPALTVRALKEEADGTPGRLLGGTRTSHDRPLRASALHRRTRLHGIEHPAMALRRRPGHLRAAPRTTPTRCCCSEACGLVEYRAEAWLS